MPRDFNLVQTNVCYLWAQQNIQYTQYQTRLGVKIAVFSVFYCVDPDMVVEGAFLTLNVGHLAYIYGHVSTINQPTASIVV